MNDAAYKALVEEIHERAAKLKREFEALEAVLAKHRKFNLIDTEDFEKRYGRIQRCCEFCGERMRYLDTRDTAAGWLCVNGKCGR